MSVVLRRLQYFFLILVCLCWLPAAAVADEQLEQNKDRLADLQKKIEKTLRDLKGKRVEAGDLNRDLNSLKTEMRRVSRQVKKSDRELAALKQKKSEQKRHLEQLEAQQEERHQQLEKRLVALYKTGDYGLMQTLLTSSESPGVLAEKYLFLTQLVRHDRQLMDDYRRQAADYQQAIDELDVLRTQQKKIAERRRKEQASLKSAQKTKASLLARVRQDETLLDEMLAELRAKAKRMNSLVKKLESEQTQTYTGNLSGLAAYKGRLPWPVEGRVRIGFGTSRQNDYGALIESHGLEISAAVGTPVKAVAEGRVIYASQLRGYGKLLIVDHGSKQYSLYAQVASLTKQVGDMVRNGEKIAYTGYEGREYLYFEIRHGGKPVDPKSWLKPR